MRTEQFQPITTAYRSLDPFEQVDPIILANIGSTLDTPLAAGGDLGNIAANIHLELGLHPAISPSEQRYHRNKAEQLLTARDDSTGDYAINVARARPYRTHLPVFIEGHSTDAKQKTRNNINALLSGFADLYRSLDYLTPDNLDEFRDAYNKGDACEDITVLLLGYTGLKGIDVYPSFERHDRHYSTHPGMKKSNSDITVISNGETIDAGEYRVQVKAFDSSSTPANRAKGERASAYHPNIAYIKKYNQLGIPSTNLPLLTELCERLIAFDGHQPPSEFITSRRDKVLEELERAGPIPDKLYGILHE